MLDKIDFTAQGNKKHIKMIKEYCSRRLIKAVYGNGAKYFHQSSIITEYFQLFYSVNIDDSINIFCSIGSKFSNRYGFYLLKKLITFGVVKIRIRRLDFAYDLHGTEAKDFSIKKFNLRNRPSNSTPSQKIYFNKINNKLIDTSYLITSRFIIRMYDKGVEQGIAPFNSDWKRFEVQLKSKFIDKYFGDKYLDFKNNSVKSILNSYKSILYEITSKYAFNHKYMKLLKKLQEGVEYRVKPLKKDCDLIYTMNWFKKTYHKYVLFYVVNNIDEIKDILDNPTKQAQVFEDFIHHWANRKNYYYYY